MPPPPPSFASTWGCQMVAYMVNAVLYGAAMLLSAQYLAQSRKDTKFTRLVVVTLTILATLQMVILSHQIYEDFVVRFGNMQALDEIIFSTPTQFLIIYVMAFVAQFFWITRVWIMTKNSVYLTAPVGLLALIAISAGITKTVLVVRVKRFSHLHTPAILAARSVQSATTAVCDVVITALLCYALHGSRAADNATDSVIDKMIVYAVERGAATSICALLNLIFFAAIPDTFIFMIPLIPSSQLYLISVISLLANQKSLRSEITSEDYVFNTRSFYISDVGHTASQRDLDYLPKTPHS
jgi:hypothetical protein